MKLKRSARSALTGAFIIFAAVFILSISSVNVSAAITKGTPFFSLAAESFGSGQLIEGTLNFSLASEPGSTKVSASIGSIAKEMHLLDFLKKANAQFSCESGCEISYTASNPADKKTTALGVEEKYFGLVVKNNNVEIKNLSFELKGISSAEATCGSSPLQLDLLNDNSVDWEYKEPAEWCTGWINDCFSVGTANAELTETPRCQKVKLNKTGAIELKAVLKLLEGGNPCETDVFITDSAGNEIASCSDSLFVDSYDYKSYTCTISSTEEKSFYLEGGSYFICIKKKEGDKCYIHAESDEPKCGVYGQPPQQALNVDYALYARTAAFAPFNTTVEFSDETSLVNNLASYLQDYIAKKYNRNCSDGCILPLRVISKTQQELTLRSLKLDYDCDMGPITESNFYDIQVLWPKINMTMAAVSIAPLNITAPEKTGQYTINAKVGSATQSPNPRFKVELVPTISSIMPLTVVPNKATLFRVMITPPAGHNIVSYRWEWGDGSYDDSAEPIKTHSYSGGTFTLTIKVTDNFQLTSSRSFTIKSELSKELLNETIKALQERLDNFALHYQELGWWRGMLGVNVTNLDKSLKEIEEKLQTAQPDELSDIKYELDQLNVPISVDDSLILEESSYTPNVEKINPSYIKDITKEGYDSSLKTEYQNAIALWQEKNVDIKFGAVIKALKHEDRTEDKVTIVSIKLKPLDGIDKLYAIFYLSDLSYDDIAIEPGSFETEELDEAIGFTFTDINREETINLALPGKQDFSAIMFYVAPKLGKLEVQPGEAEEGEKPYGLAIFLMIVIVIALAAALWLIWKNARKKEKKLFKNPMDLYNITSFIVSNEKAGVPKTKITEKLVEAGWSKEQIDCAFKKIKKEKRPRE